MPSMSINPLISAHQSIYVISDHLVRPTLVIIGAVFDILWDPGAVPPHEYPADEYERTSFFSILHVAGPV